MRLRELDQSDPGRSPLSTMALKSPPSNPQVFAVFGSIVSLVTEGTVVANRPVGIPQKAGTNSDAEVFVIHFEYVYGLV